MRADAGEYLNGISRWKIPAECRFLLASQAVLFKGGLFFVSAWQHQKGNKNGVLFEHSIFVL